MTDREMLEELCGLAASAGLAVQQVPGGRVADGGPPVTSATVRVRGEARVILVAGDSVDERIRVVAAALREHRAEWLEDHHVAPALRARLEQAG